MPRLEIFRANLFSILTRLPTHGMASCVGLFIVIMIALPCFVTLPWSLERYDIQRLDGDLALSAPSFSNPMGTDVLGRSLMWRILLGGSISLSVGGCAAMISVVIGVLWGALAGYIGGRTDMVMMRMVDVLYGLPYILLVVLIDIALQPQIEWFTACFLSADLAHGFSRVLTLLIAIGSVSWLTMARVIRGQVLSLRAQPFTEAARSYGAGTWRILYAHLLPNLLGPIVVYTTLTVPTAILQESFLSFLGIGVQPPLPSWGNLAAQGISELHGLGQPGIKIRWWLIVWPCTLLGLTLVALNLIGDSLRMYLDPKQQNG